MKQRNLKRKQRRETSSRNGRHKPGKDGRAKATGMKAADVDVVKRKKRAMGDTAAKTKHDCVACCVGATFGNVGWTTMSPLMREREERASERGFITS